MNALHSLPQHLLAQSGHKRTAISVCACALILCSGAFAQAVRSTTPGGGVLVHVEEASGGPIQVQATVTLSSSGSAEGFMAETRGGGVATFRAVPAGDYSVQVSAPGYETTRESVMVMSSSTAATVYISLHPRGVLNPGSSGSQLPLLTGKSRKELDAALGALRQNKLEDASKHVEYALKHAAGDPNVQYIAGEYFVRMSDFDVARAHFETAVKIFPGHTTAQLELGSLLLQQLNDSRGAIPHLEAALSLDSTSWRGHWLLAQAYIIAGLQIDRAELHARRAMELGKERAAAAAVTLAYAQVVSGNRLAARATLNTFLAAFPRDAAAPRARLMLAAAELSGPDSLTSTAEFSSLHSATPPSNYGSASDARPSWLPHGVDDAGPSASGDGPCNLSEILESAGQRAGEFAGALERFAATENFTHDELDSSGGIRHSSDGRFDYIAIVERPAPDRVSVREVRTGSAPRATRADPVMSEGIPAIELLFDPLYANDFEFTCEERALWRGEAVWRVHFAQRRDRDPRILAWLVNGKSYPALLKGRAWVSAASFRVLRLEAELLDSLPQIRLDYEHISIDYAPVTFREGCEELWLPSYVEVYRKFRGKYFREEHRFSDFLLFSVDTRQKIESPNHR